MTTSQKLPVLIVGAGPSGLVAALSLLQNNVPVRIIDKRAEPSIGFKGSGIQPRSLELYRFLGILDDIMAKSSAFPMSRIYDCKAGTSVDFHRAPAVNPTPSVPYPNIRRLAQGTHESILRDQLAKHNCFVEFSTSLESFEQQEDQDIVIAHLVTANTTDSTNPPEPSPYNFAYMIGCDGGKGITRKLLGLPFEGDSHAAKGLAGDIRVEGGLDKNFWHTWQHHLGMLTLCYTGNENIFAIVMLEGHTPLPTPDRESLLKTVTTITGREDIEFGELVNLQEWKPNSRMVPSFQKGRVFLAGDAAHIHSPTGGQGLNSSIQDSHNLAWKLSLVYYSLASSSLLDSYTAERYPVIKQMLSATGKLLKATHGAVTAKQESSPASQSSDSAPTPASASTSTATGSAAGGVIRTGTTTEVGLNKTLNTSTTSNTSPYKRGGTLLMLGINYRGSPILIDERNPSSQMKGDENDYYDSTKDGLVCAGDRAGDAPVDVLSELGDLAGEAGEGRRTTLFSLFKGTRHAVLAFSSGVELVQTVHEVLKSRFPGIPVKIAWEYAYAHYAVSSSPSPQDVAGEESRENKDTVVVVRPDGVIGAIVLSGAVGVGEYFARLVREV